MDFTELQRLARSLGLRARIEFPKDADAIPRHVSEGKTVIVQIDRLPLDGEATSPCRRHPRRFGDSAAFLDPLRATLTPPGERNMTRELFDDIHQISLICDLP